MNGQEESSGSIDDQTVLINGKKCFQFRVLERSSDTNTTRNESHEGEESAAPVVVGQKKPNNLNGADRRGSWPEIFGNVLKTGDKSDLTFIVGKSKEKIQAHRLILQARSKTFSDLLSSIPGDISYYLPDVRPCAFKFFLDYIYTGDFRKKEDISDKDLVDLLGLAMRYKAYALLSQCTNLLKSRITIENVFKIFEKVEHCKIKDLRDMTFSFIMKNGAPLLKSDKLFCLNICNLRKILGSDRLSCPEVEIFKAAVRWAEHSLRVNSADNNQSSGPQPNQLRIILNSIIPLIRFTLMTPQQLSEIVAASKILTAEELVEIYNYVCSPNHKQMTLFNKNPRICVGEHNSTFTSSSSTSTTNTAISGKGHSKSFETPQITGIWSIGGVANITGTNVGTTNNPPGPSNVVTPLLTSISNSPRHPSISKRFATAVINNLSPPSTGIHQPQPTHRTVDPLNQYKTNKITPRKRTHDGTSETDILDTTTGPSQAKACLSAYSALFPPSAFSGSCTNYTTTITPPKMKQPVQRNQKLEQSSKPLCRFLMRNKNFESWDQFFQVFFKSSLKHTITGIKLENVTITNKYPRYPCQVKEIYLDINIPDGFQRLASTFDVRQFLFFMTKIDELWDKFKIEIIINGVKMLKINKPEKELVISFRNDANNIMSGLGRSDQLLKLSLVETYIPCFDGFPCRYLQEVIFYHLHAVRETEVSNFVRKCINLVEFSSWVIIPQWERENAKASTVLKSAGPIELDLSKDFVSGSKLKHLALARTVITFTPKTVKEGLTHLSLETCFWPDSLEEKIHLLFPNLKAIAIRQKTKEKIKQPYKSTVTIRMLYNILQINSISWIRIWGFDWLELHRQTSNSPAKKLRSTVGPITDFETVVVKSLLVSCGMKHDATNFILEKNLHMNVWLGQELNDKEPKEDDNGFWDFSDQLDYRYYHLHNIFRDYHTFQNNFEISSEWP